MYVGIDPVSEERRPYDSVTLNKSGFQMSTVTAVSCPTRLVAGYNLCFLYVLNLHSQT